jgi:hypothetical protein
MDTSPVTVPVFGIGLAVIVAFFANYLWFGPRTFYPVWARALGRPADAAPGQRASGEGSNMALVFGLTLVGSVVMATTMSWVLQAAAALYRTDISVGAGALIGFLVGVGIAAAASLGHRLFAGQGLLVWAIEVGGDILGLTLMGAVLAIYV